MNNGIIDSNQYAISNIQRNICISNKATKIAGINNSLSSNVLDYTNISNFDIFANSINIKAFTTRGLTIGNLYKELRTFPTATSFPGGTSHINCVLMADGRIFFCPFLNNTGLILNPVRGAFSTPGGTYGTSNNTNGNYSAGVLLFNEEILLVPRNAACRVYNAKTDSVRIIGSAPAVTTAYTGGILMKNGKVYCLPNGLTTALIIDPINNTTIVPTGTFPYTGFSLGGVLLPDGRVMIITSTNAQHRIYDPYTDKLTVANCQSNGGQNGCLLPDGRVYIAPVSPNTSAVIYNPVTDSTTTANGTFPSAAWNACNLTVDGGVYVNPTVGPNSPRIYYYGTDTLVTIPGTMTSNNEFTNALYIYDGRLLLVPRTSTTVKFYGYSGSPKFDDNVNLSAYYNKRG